jgi:hypothetical protein
MDTAETCHFCGDSDGRIVPWFVQTERRSIHMPCFLAALRSGDAEASDSAPEQAAA